LTNWQYIILKPAQRYLEKMQTTDQKKIINALDTLVSEDTGGLDLKSLKGRPEKRLRVGKYRILYVVTVIGSRGDVYK
jgi:mRNA interferase RelE/StbE